MTRRVSLPMYDVPSDALEQFWLGLRAHMLEAGLVDVPNDLKTPDDLETHWLDPDLLLSQACGYPLTAVLSERVQYVGTPHYRAPGCEGPRYSSALVVRADIAARQLPHLRGLRAAYNSDTSQSGYNSLRALAAPFSDGGRFFAATLPTGSHRLSVAAVRKGRADLAAVDAVTWALLSRDHPAEVAGLRVMAFTGSAPGLPLITAQSTPPVDLVRLRQAWVAALSDPRLREQRAALLLDGFTVLAEADYATIPAMERHAAALGYPILA